MKGNKHVPSSLFLRGLFLFIYFSPYLLSRQYFIEKPREGSHGFHLHELTVFRLNYSCRGLMLSSFIICSKWLIFVCLSRSCALVRRSWCGRRCNRNHMRNYWREGNNSWLRERSMCWSVSSTSLSSSWTRTSPTSRRGRASLSAAASSWRMVTASACLQVPPLSYFTVSYACRCIFAASEKSVDWFFWILVCWCLCLCLRFSA